MNEVIIVKPERCVGCNACVRSCPSPEANRIITLDNGKLITSVDANRCIACGQCVKSCKHGARDYIDGTEDAMSTLAKEKMIVVVSPAIRTVFPTKWKGILDWFRSKGCLMFDGAFGADICTWAHLRLIDHNEQTGVDTNLITQQCAAVVKYIEIYQPKLLPNLSKIHSPEACAIIYVKNYLRRTEPIMFLSPCISKTLEFESTGLAEYNVTFKKLMEYFDKNDIRIPTNPDEAFDYKFDEQQGLLGNIYSRPGGFRDNLWLHNPDLDVTTSEGALKVYPELELYSKMAENKHPEIFDVLSCEFGCNLGPGTGSEQTSFDVMASMRSIEREAKSRRKVTGGVFRGGEDKLFKRFDDELNFSDFVREYKASMPTLVPAFSDLEPIFEMLGMHDESQRHTDCHACGYRSCREMATAIYRGLNTPQNCIVHAKDVLLSRHSHLTEQHDSLAEITQECLDLSDRLREEIGEITENMSSIENSTNATSERSAVVNDLLKDIVAFCNSKTTMDTASVKQLVSILETTIDAFADLDDNVNVTNESSGVIKTSIEDISKLVDSINETLKQASENG
ncbi:MAG: 4Fe-4S binding protein [Oscillospiraceae bacterium]|nr:4Fe-4S binding protein [Oscillospiraceae bacterium]